MTEKDRKPQVGEVERSFEPGEAEGYQTATFSRNDLEGVPADEPSATGALIDTRLIGVIELEETEDGKTERNDRIIAVAAISHLYAKVNDLADLGSDYTDNLARFWINKNAIEGKQVRVRGLR